MNNQIHLIILLNFQLNLHLQHLILILQSKQYPSNIGTVCDTPSPLSNTIPVVLPDAYNDNTAPVLQHKMMVY